MCSMAWGQVSQVGISNFNFTYQAPQGSGTAENIDVPDQQPAPSFGDNSLAGGPADADPESEVAAFANREQGRDGTTA